MERAVGAIRVLDVGVAPLLGRGGEDGDPTTVGTQRVDEALAALVECGKVHA